MKRFSAQYIITNSGPPVKRGIVTTEDDGTIISIEDNSGDLHESHSVKFYNGIIIPGFVNCHCHLELSHMRSTVEKGTGLGGFLVQISKTRETEPGKILQSALSANNDMINEGIVLCADISNTSDTFALKKSSIISYISLLEVFGIDPEKAMKRIDSVTKVAEEAEEINIPYYLVPHSVYSMSLTLLRLLRNKSENNKVTSIHFMETPGEKELLENHTGKIVEAYTQSGFLPPVLETVRDHASAILNEITQSGNMILVHNTFTDRDVIGKVIKRNNLYWCLCPNSNIYIENTVPPLDLLLEMGCEIVIGTDSLASNNKLSIISELKTLQLNFPSVSIEELILWATLNGAKALGKEDVFGKIEPGKKPGLLLLENVDLINMKILSESFVTRLL